MDGAARIREWTRGLRRNDTRAWKRLLRFTRERLARMNLPPGLDSEDLAVTIVAEVWLALGQLEHDERLLAFTWTIARRIIYQEQHDASSVDVPLTNGTIPRVDDVQVENVEAEARFDWLMAGLSPTERHLFGELFAHGKGTSEIQDDLSRSESNVRVQKHRLRQKLKALVDAFERERERERD